MQDLFVTCPHGFEPILEKELKSLGLYKVRTAFCGVFIPKSLSNVFLVNYMSRVATRVLFPIAQFPCKDKEELYKKCKEVPWSTFLHCDKTFAIDANVQHHNLINSLYASLVVKDAICDFFREKVGARPSVDKQFPDVQLNLFIQKGMASLYIDTSGAPLHKRGWRQTNTEATLHESLAAGLLLFTGYRKDNIFCDPFCGSGTFLVEAGLIATNTPPGFLRKKWGFFNLPGFEKSNWLKWKATKDKARISLPKGKIFGSDKSREASDITRSHLQKALLGNVVDVAYDDIAYYKPKVAPDFIVTNPPYGKRLEVSIDLFRNLKDFLKEKAPQAKAFALSPEPEALQKAEIKTAKELSFKNGGLAIKLLSISHDY